VVPLQARSVSWAARTMEELPQRRVSQARTCSSPSAQPHQRHATRRSHAAMAARQAGYMSIAPPHSVSLRTRSP
jgi:hypothetical protein